MTRFLDGPAAGQTLMLGRAPVYLRVVKGETWDALDQIGDTPNDDETVHVYRLVKTAGIMHVDGRDKKTGKRFGNWYTIAEYELAPEQPDDVTMRDTLMWQTWAAQQTWRPK